MDMAWLAWQWRLDVMDFLERIGRQAATMKAQLLTAFSGSASQSSPNPAISSIFNR